MKTVDLALNTTSIEDIFQLAHRHNVLVRTPEGKVFMIAEVDMTDDFNDFADEVQRTRQSPEMMKLLSERSHDPSRISSEEARKRLGL